MNNIFIATKNSIDLLILVNALLMSDFAFSSPTLSNSTEIKIFKPWQFTNEKITKQLTIEKTTNGECWTASIINPRPDAWRCRIDNQILDPCFSPNPVRKQVACSASPLTYKVIVLNLKQALPQANESNFIGKNPWLIKLQNGQYCYPIGGATFGFVGERNSYSCGNNQGLIFGSVNCHHSRCQALYYPQNSTSLHYESIAELWY